MVEADPGPDNEALLQDPDPDPDPGREIGRLGLGVTGLEGVKVMLPRLF